MARVVCGVTFQTKKGTKAARNLRLLLLLSFIDSLGAMLEGLPSTVFNEMALKYHFEDFTKGVIDIGNIIYYLQKIIEKSLITLLAPRRPELIPPLIVVIFFCSLVAIFLAIFEFTKLLQFILH